MSYELRLVNGMPSDDYGPEDKVITIYEDEIVISKGDDEQVIKLVPEEVVWIRRNDNGKCRVFIVKGEVKLWSSHDLDDCTFTWYNDRFLVTKEIK